MNNCLLTLGSALLSISFVQATPIYTASLGSPTGCGSGIPQSVSSTPIALTGNWTCGTPTRLAEGTALAGPGAVGAYAKASSNELGAGGSSAAAFAEMQTTFVIKGPTGGPATIPVSLNLHFSGFTGNSSVVPDTTGWTMSLNARQFGQGAVRSNLAGTGLLATIPSGNGILVDTIITTPTVMFAVGPTHILELGLGVSAVARSLTAFSEIDFSNTLTFPTSGPVFNLPAGYTIDVPDFNIFDNQFIPDGATGVPEPSSMALSGVALIAVWLLRRKRRSLPRHPFE